MIKTIFLIFFIFYILALIETGFLINSRIIFFNFILIMVILINFLNFSYQEKLISTFLAGFFLDVFSLTNPINFFGFYILILLAGFYVLKIISQKYVRLSFFSKK